VHLRRYTKPREKPVPLEAYSEFVRHEKSLYFPTTLQSTIISLLPRAADQQRTTHVNMTLSAERLSQLEVAAMQAVAALKDAKKIRSKKADWRLVAAAQAMHRGELLDEFEAAAAMGKTIAQRREVSNWMERLKELETCAVT
jgi:hypothetical protein